MPGPSEVADPARTAKWCDYCANQSTASKDEATDIWTRLERSVCRELDLLLSKYTNAFEIPPKKSEAVGPSKMSAATASHDKNPHLCDFT